MADRCEAMAQGFPLPDEGFHRENSALSLLHMERGLIACCATDSCSPLENAFRSSTRRESMATAKKKAGKKGAKKAAKKSTRKAAAKKAPAKKAKRAPNPAFMKAMTPSATLAPVVGANPMPRTEA